MEPFKGNVPEGSDLEHFFYWDSLHARLNNHFKARSYKKKKTKGLEHTGNQFRKNLQLKHVC